MAKNIIEAIQTNLGYPPLQKIDPNNQEVKNTELQGDRVAQAAIPAVLTALYKLSRTDEGAAKIITAKPADDILSLIYEGKEASAVEKVAQYAGITNEQAEGYMENIADESFLIIQKEAGDKLSVEKLKTYMNDQRHHILVYLPAALNMGDMLNDNTLDDRTNKMEGPVSNMMHKIENILSGGGES